MSHSAGGEPEPCPESGLRLSHSLSLIYRLFSLKIYWDNNLCFTTEGKTFLSCPSFQNPAAWRSFVDQLEGFEIAWQVTRCNAALHEYEYNNRCPCPSAPCICWRDNLGPKA